MASHLADPERTALWVDWYNAQSATRAVPLDASDPAPARKLIDACHLLPPPASACLTRPERPHQPRHEADQQRQRAQHAHGFPVPGNDEAEACANEGDAEAQHLPVVGIAKHSTTAPAWPPGHNTGIQQDDEQAHAPDQQEDQQAAPAGWFGHAPLYADAQTLRRGRLKIVSRPMARENRQARSSTAVPRAPRNAP